MEYLAKQKGDAVFESCGEDDVVISADTIVFADGRVLGKMCHSERIGKGVGINLFGEQDQKIFESGVEYFQ